MPRPRPDGTKYCPDCEQIKSVEEFYKSEKYDGGYSPYCRACHRIRNNNRDRKKTSEAHKKWYQNLSDEDKQRSLARAIEYTKRIRKENPARFRAKKFFDGRNGVEIAPDITREFLEELFRTTTNCQCCGKELCLEYKERETRKYRSNPNSPSIDRVNNHKGYTRSNIAVICWECNYRKTDLSLDDLAMMVAYIKKYGDFQNV